MSALKSLTVELPEEQLRFIEEQVASGAYSSASELVSSGLLELGLGAHEESAELLAECDDIASRVEAGEETYTLAQVMAVIKDDLDRHRNLQRHAAE